METEDPSVEQLADVACHRSEDEGDAQQVLVMLGLEAVDLAENTEPKRCGQADEETSNEDRTRFVELAHGKRSPIATA